MYVSSLMELPMCPNLGSLMGTSGRQDVLKRINNEWNGSQMGVIFGSSLDPFANRYSQIMDVVHTGIKKAENMLKSVGDTIFNRDIICPIISERDLWNTTPTMEWHLINYEPLKTLLNEDKIYGWGYEPNQLLEEDVVGRMINNEKWDSSSDKEDIEFYWESTDPDLSWDELDTIDESRRYIDSFLENELKIKCTKRDPTNLAGRIG